MSYPIAASPRIVDRARRPVGLERLTCLSHLRTLGLFVALCAIPAALQATGYFGEACLSPGRRCNEGVCVGIVIFPLGPVDLCTQCGGPGEPGCDPRSVPPVCYNQREGYRLIDGYCQKRGPRVECGLRGTPPCRFGGQMVCYQGTSYNADADVCVACGDLGQPCCVFTSYPCDYGKCTVDYPHEGGRCVDLGKLGPTDAEPEPPVAAPPPPSAPTPARQRVCRSRDGRDELCRQHNCDIPTLTTRTCWSSDGRHGMCRQNNCQPQPPCYWEETVVQQGVPCYWAEE